LETGQKTIVKNWCF